MSVTYASPPRADTAVDGEDHARGVTRSIGSEEGHQIADLARMRRPAKRQAFLEFLVAIFVAELGLCARLQKRDVAIRADRTWVDADHADVVGKALAAERAGERHQRRVAGAAADVIGVEFLAGGADIVDDHAMPARLHLRVDGAGEIDIAEHL